MAANYYLSGYQSLVPQGYESRESVASIQQQLNMMGANLSVDGVWGPKTNAAYQAFGSAGGENYGTANYGTNSYGASGYGLDGGMDLSSLYDQALGILSPNYVSYNVPSYNSLMSDNAGILRPQYDSAIAQRQRQTLENRSEIDVDAASRGMGRSTYVTDVKSRAMDKEAEDVAKFESEYSAALAKAVQEQYDRHLANKLAADQFNAQAQLAAQNAAFNYASGSYKDNLAYKREQAQLLAQAAAKAASSSSGRSSSGSSQNTQLGDDVRKELRVLANDIYNYNGGNQSSISSIINQLKSQKTYDSLYQPGASDYLSGALSGLLQVRNK